jgi:hypothetical protein
VSRQSFAIQKNSGREFFSIPIDAATAGLSSEYGLKGRKIPKQSGGPSKPRKKHI